MIKVALVNNMNNNFFAFARYLRDLGIDAHLYEIPNSSLDHFKPQADTFQNVNELKWLHYFPTNVNGKGWLFFKKELIANEFKRYDLIISCGLSSAFLYRAGIKSDIIIPYGLDLYQLPFAKIKFSFNLLKFIINIVKTTQAKYQREAYKNARVVITNLSHSLYNESIKKLSINAIDFNLSMLYNMEKVDCQLTTKFSFLKKHDFIVFNHSRQIWCSNPDNLKDFDKYKGNKRNDKTIKAFAKFLKITKFKNPVLVLFEYGPDVECSKKLINELGIQNYVKWIEKSYRKEIMIGLKRASLAVDQIRERICGIGGTSYEILASGVPLLTFTNGVIQDKKNLFYNAPIVEVLTEDDIFNVFIDYEKNPQKYKEIGKKAKEWFDENLGIGLAKKYVKLIELLVKDKTLTQNDKAVREIFEK